MGYGDKMTPLLKGLIISLITIDVGIALTLVLGWWAFAVNLFIIWGLINYK
jgi:hypothetical protein